MKGRRLHDSGIATADDFFEEFGDGEEGWGSSESCSGG